MIFIFLLSILLWRNEPLKKDFGTSPKVRDARHSRRPTGIFSRSEESFQPVKEIEPRTATGMDKREKDYGSAPSGITKCKYIMIFK
jgi:hypothetical protein